MEYDYLTKINNDIKIREENEILLMNSDIKKFGLFISEQEAKNLIKQKEYSLKSHKRIEINNGIIKKLIYIFSDSQYINKEIFCNTINELLDIFYYFKNETEDYLTDIELLNFMKDQFENVCFGDITFLKDTCLERLNYALKNGYKGHIKYEGKRIYNELSEETKWEDELYKNKLKELFWE